MLSVLKQYLNNGLTAVSEFRSLHHVAANSVCVMYYYDIFAFLDRTTDMDVATQQKKTKNRVKTTGLTH